MNAKDCTLSETERVALIELRRPQAGAYTGEEMSIIHGLTPSDAAEVMESLTRRGLARRIKHDCLPVVWCTL